jgi:hypothetical protein
LQISTGCASSRILFVLLPRGTIHLGCVSASWHLGQRVLGSISIGAISIPATSVLNSIMLFSLAG